MSTELELTDWRRRVNELYSHVRQAREPSAGHALWRTARDDLFRTHPQSPLLPADPIRERGIGYWPYDPAQRFEVPILEPGREESIEVATSSDATIRLRLIGRVALPDPLRIELDVWWLHQYGGGVFIPLRDATAGTTTYGGGRYLLDTAKGADLGGTDATIVPDMKFAYHPSCRYNPAWECPLAPPGNRT